MKSRTVKSAALSVVIGMLGVLAVLVPAGQQATAAPTTGRFSAIAPVRVLDTRDGTGGARRVPAGKAIDVQIAGVGGVPANATAAVFNLTAVSTAAAGFISAFPAGSALPATSSLNFTGPVAAIANLVTVSIGAGGRVALFASTDSDLIVDITGYYVPAATATAGRFVSLTPARALDTRTIGAPVLGGTTRIVDLSAVGVPASASAAVVKLTLTEPVGPGFVTAFPADTALPLASNVNYGAGETISNQVIGGVTGARLAIFALTTTHVIVDVKGYFTGAGAASSADGLFVALPPARLIDTRDGGQPVPAGSETNVAVAGRAGMPQSGIAAVVINATLTASSSAGFVTVWPANTPRPNTSDLNARFAGDTFAGHSVTPVSTAGLAMWSLIGQHLIADVTGYYTGAPMDATVAPQPAGYTFLQTYQSKVVRWNPCTVLRYAINTNGYGNEQMIHDAVANAAGIAGITVQFVGSSSWVATRSAPLPPEVAKATRRSGPFDILVSLGDPSMTDLVGGSTVGLAVNFSAMGTGFGVQFTKSSVMIDMRSAANGLYANDGTASVMRHEVAHALGLGHVDDTAQTMNPSIGWFTPNHYAQGDTAGLRAVGVNTGCIVDSTRTQSAADDIVHQVELD